MTTPPYPSIADVFYLGFYPASYVGLLLLLRARLRSLTPGVWVDGITAALAVAAIGSAVLIGVVLDTTDGSASVVATNMAYPLGDVILLSLVVGGFASRGGIPGAPGPFSERRSRSALSPTAPTSTRRRPGRTAREASSMPRGRPACS